MSLSGGIVTRSGSTSSLIVSNAKRSREDLSKQDDGEIGSLDDLWSRMQLMLSTTSERIEKKIEICNGALEKRMSNIEDQLTVVRQECIEKVNNLEQSVLAVRNKIDQAVETAYRIEKNKELVISGIPYQSQENLSEIYRMMALSIDYDDNRVPLANLQRMARVPIAPGSSPLILCEFALRQERNEFYRLYLSKRSLCLRDIGFDSGNRLYVNENLTKNARLIRAEAIKFRKLGQLESVTTRNGIVYIKRKRSDTATAVDALQKIASVIIK